MGNSVAESWCFSVTARSSLSELLSWQGRPSLIAPGGRGRSPAPRLPQNVACRFPALRSSEVASQLGDSLQLRVREIQLWSQQRKPLLDPMELLPPDLPLPTTAAQHFAPITFHGRWTRCSARMFPAMPQYAFQETELHGLSRHNPAQIRTCGAGSVERNARSRERLTAALITGPDPNPEELERWLAFL